MDVLFPAGIYLFEANNGNTYGEKCEICDM